MLDLNYNLLQFASVTNLQDFYTSNSRLKETGKIKSMIDASKLLFKLPSDRILLDVAQEDRVYRLNFISPDVKKIILGYIVYLPLQERLDFYTNIDLTIPMIQWKRKKVVFNGFPDLLQRASIEKILDRIIINS